MTRWRLNDWWDRHAQHVSRVASDDATEALPPELGWYLFDVWLEQAKSLNALGMDQLADRKLKFAADVAARSVNGSSDSATAWINLARVRVVSENFDGAIEALNRGKELADLHHEEGAATMALYLAAELTRKRANGDGNDLDIASGMFYVCQQCGHLVYYIGGHCPHCQFVPKTLSDVRLSMVLSRRFFRVETLLNVAVEILYRKKRPSQFIDSSELKSALDKVADDECMGVLRKIQDRLADDHLDFSALEYCKSCKALAWESWLDICRVCGAPLERPALAKFVICVERVLHHFILFVRHDKSNELAGVVTLLIWMKSAGLREQIGPSRALRDLVLANLPRLSPIYSQNDAGVVYVDKNYNVHGTTLKHEANEIDATIDNFVRELSQLMGYLKADISLF